MHANTVLLSVPGEDRLQIVERPRPAVAVGELLVRVAAIGINNADQAPASEERVAGFEFTGTVEAAGEGVPGDSVGTRVMGLAGGAFAEYVVADARHVMPVPDGFDDGQAAASPTALITEYGALRRAEVADGESVVIVGATSAIGLVGIQMAKALGASVVVATTRTAAKRDLLMQAGADAVIITGEEDLPARVKELTGGTGADIVLDHVGGDLLDAGIAAARPGGRVISVGRLAGPTAEIDLFALARSGATVQSVSFGFTPPSVIEGLMEGVRSDVWNAIEEGRIRPVIGRRVRFGEVPDTLVAQREGERVDGKVVGVIR